MISDQVKQAEDAARFITRVLTGFSESKVYEDYQAVEDFTDEEYEQAIETLTEFGNGPAVTERAVDFAVEREQAQHAAGRAGLLDSALRASLHVGAEDAFDHLATETRYDWHEPDEQGIGAIVIGCRLDNAFGDSVLDGDHGEFNVVLFKNGRPATVRNLTTLLAEAAAFRRQANRGSVQTLAEQAQIAGR